MRTISRSLITIPFLALVLVACATGRPAQQRSEFEDIPVPKGLALQNSQSTIIESPSVKAARLVYRGRIEPGSLALALRTTLEANGWRNVSSTANGKDGAMQVYEKGGNSLTVQVWEEIWYTYVALTASRATVPAAAQQQ